MMPTVSVVIPSYNHARFLDQAIRSALDQTFRDLEVIVVDDGSSDGSVEIARAHRDPRLQVVAFERNRGAAIATNHGIGMARAPYVAILNSDDAWKPDKIEKQVRVLEDSPNLAAVFTWVNFVDERSRIVPDGTFWFQKIFEQENRSRGQWLRRFFLEANCLCHPSVLIRRGVYETVGLYDERFRQLPDLHMWVRVCKHADIRVLPERLVDFRMLQGEANTSSASAVNDARVATETHILFEDFFNGMSREVFLDGFRDLCVAQEVGSDLQMRVEQAFIMVSMMRNDLGKSYWPIGLRKIFDLLGDPASETLLRERYGFGPREFHELTGRIRLFASATAPPGGELRTVLTRSSQA